MPMRISGAALAQQGCFDEAIQCACYCTPNNFILLHNQHHVHDLRCRPTVGVLHRRERTHRVPEGQQDHRLAIVGEPEHGSRVGLLPRRGVAAPDPQVGGDEHHAHRRLSEIERERLARVGVLRRRRQQGDRGRRAGDVGGPLPQRGHPFQRRALGHDDEVPGLLVHRGGRPPTRLDDPVEVVGSIGRSWYLRVLRRARTASQVSTAPSVERGACVVAILAPDRGDRHGRGNATAGCADR